MSDSASTSWSLSAVLAQADVGFRSPAAAWLLPLGLVAVVALTLWLYRGTNIQRRWRVALAVMRGMVLAVVLAMLFQPVLVLQAASQVRQHVLVLVDHSQSMDLRDERQSLDARAEARLALGEQANPYATTQSALAGLWRALREAETALQRQQWPALLEAHGKWRDRLDALDLNDLHTGPLRDALPAWREQADRLDDQINRWLIQSDPTGEQEDVLAHAHAQLRGQVDEQLRALGDAVRRHVDGGSELATMPSRLELAKGLFSAEQGGVFKALERQREVRYFTFGDELRSPPQMDDSASAASRQALLQVDADAQSTQLGSALNEVVARHAGRPIAGVIVLTDGRANRGLDAISVADQLGERGIGIYPLGLGLPEPPDVAIEQMAAPPVSFVRDEVPLRVQVRSTGYVGRSVNVTATLDGEPMAEQSLVLEQGRQWVELPFSVDEPMEAGELEVRVSELDGEVSHTNNREQQNLRVIDEKIQVLYVEGKPRWEFRYLRQVLLRDHRLDVHLLMTEGDRDLARLSDVHLASLPSNPEAVFEYDLIILGDVPASYFTGRQLEMLSELVRERGGALAMLAGSQHAPASYANTPLDAALPVRIGTRRSVPVSDAGRWRITDAGRRSAITRLAPEDAANQRLWQQVNPMVRLPDVAGVKAGATVLAELTGDEVGSGDGPYPLLAWQRYGSGRSLFLASDQLWRLRFRRGDEHHARFWGQTIQFLTLARVMGEASRVQISTDADQYNAGQRVRVSAHVLGEGYEPLPVDRYTLTLQPSNGAGEARPLELEAVPDTAGVFEADFAAEAGTYRIIDPAEPDEAVPVTFRVTEEPLEMIEPTMDEALLRQLAERSGGRYLTAADWPAVEQLLSPEPRPVTVRRERDLWSQPWLFAMLVGLLGGEWFVRRRMQQL